MKQNGKRWISLALVLCMVLTLLPVTAAAGDTEHTHCVCGETDCAEHGNAVSFNALTGDAMNQFQEISEGTYYLAEDITADSDTTIRGNVILCLNGHTLNLNGNHIELSEYTTLTICDCRTTPTYGNLNDSGLWVKSDTAGNCDLTGGVITGGRADRDNSQDAGQGGAIKIISYDAHLMIYSGNIAGNVAECGGAVYLGNKSTVSLYGGSIIGNMASGGKGAGTDGGNRCGGGGVYVNGGNTFYMTGGSIEKNTVAASEKNDGGGGVLVNNGTFEMTGGSITGNSVTGHTYSTGGGVYVNGGTFTMTDGIISDNSAPNGGGVTVFKGTPYANTFRFTLSGGSITGNSATATGGGIYVLPSTTFELSGAPVIGGNTADSAPSNICLLGPTITLTGALKNSSPYGVCMQAPGVFTSGLSGYGTIANFISDSSDYVVLEDGGEAMLHRHTYTYAGNGDTITESCSDCGHNATATISIPDGADLTYTGSEIQPAKVEYRDGWLSGTLEPTYENNVDVGQATAKINVGTDAEASVTFQITPKTFESGGITVSPIPNQTYTGQPLTPDVTITFGNETLLQNTDYTLNYQNNINQGTATVEITFQGNYSGSTTAQFEIVYETLPGDKTLADYVTIPPASADGWHNQDIVLKPSGDVTIGTTDAATGGVTISTEGIGTQDVFIKDGDHIYKTELGYKLDKTKPVISDLTAAPSGWTADDVTVSFTATDALSGIAGVTVSKDGGTAQAITGNGENYTFEATENGTYTVTVTDLAGNKTEKTITISNIDRTTPDLTVTGGMESAASLTLTVEAVSKGNSPVSVTVQKGNGKPEEIQNGDYSIFAPGTYTFTATTGAGKTEQKEITIYGVTIGEDPQLVVSGGTVTEPTPAPTKNGYTFKGWYDGENMWDFADPVTGDLILTAKWTLNAPTSVTITGAGTVTYGTEVTLTAVVAHAAGELKYTYQWYKGDEPLSGETEKTLTLQTVTDSGAYKVEVTAEDGEGLESQSKTSEPVTVTINKAPVTIPTADETVFTYTGTAQTYEIAGSELYTVSGNVGTDADTYTVTVSLNDKANYVWEGSNTDDRTYTFVIHPATVAIPAADETVFTYTGAAQTYEIADSELYTVSGNVETEADTYTVTVSLNDKANYVWTGDTTEDQTYTFTIDKKPITGTWQGLSQVYDGDEAEVKILLDGLVEGDENLVATITGEKTTAGSHTLTATLDNYEITPATATLVIQKKPVVITVTDNAVAPGGEPQVNVPDLPDIDYDVIYKDKDGDVVEDLSKPGNYEVWVRFPEDSNYRHPDGNSEAPVGSVTVSETKPTQYTVTFDGNGADNGSMADLKLAGGSILTLPAGAYTKTGFQFTGWQYGGTTYRTGDRVTTAYGNMTFTAQWQETAGSVSGLVDQNEQSVEGAVISLWLGANKLAETNTDVNGRYAFNDLLSGIYNLVVSHGQKTVTSMVEIDGGNETRNFSLPVGITNSVVEVTPGSPDIVVGNLDTVFDKTNGDDYTEADAETVGKGGKVEITFKVDEQPESAVGEETVKNLQSAGGSNLSLFLDCTLTKTVTDKTGTITTEIHQSSEVLEVRLPLPTELQGKYDYTVSRIHEDEAQVLTTTANELGEYFEVSADKTVLTLHVRCFSTYAVGYRNAPSAPTYPPEKEESENGSYTVSPSRPGKGDTVTITPKPDEGYVVDGVTVIDRNGDPVAVERNDDGTYSFTQPGGSVTITVTFRPGAAYDGCPRDKTCPMAAFPDLVTTAWYHDGVHYCLDEGLMEGHDDGTFGPNGTLTRAQLVQILWNLEGRPSAEGGGVFADVAGNAWYSAAVTWANENGIVTGYGDGTFGPGKAITREQLAAILYRYAQYRKYDVSVGEDTNILSYTDAFDISEYAVPAFQWACGAGVIEGVTDSTLVPGGTATRAQAATMLMRFDLLFEN